MKPSERCNLEIDRWVEDGGDTRNKAQVIADSTGCDEALELLRIVEWSVQNDSGLAYCVACGCLKRNGHHCDCRLAAYLKKYGGSAHD